MAVLALASANSGCGNAGNAPTARTVNAKQEAGSQTAVVRVAGAPIAKATIARWTTIVGRGGAFGGSRGEPQGSPKTRALALLISSTWLIAQAQRDGVGSPVAVMSRALRRRESAAGFAQELRASGESLADVKFELRAELALAALLQELARRSSQIGGDEVARYYTANRSRFHLPEVRLVDLLEDFHSPAEASAVARRVDLVARAPSNTHHEHVMRDSHVEATPEKRELVGAIYSARPGVLSRPIRIERLWVIFVLREVLPAHYQPLARIRGEVIAQLQAARRQQLTESFDREYKARWLARTSCLPAYVAPGCPQSRGALGSYEDPFTAP